MQFMAILYDQRMSGNNNAVLDRGPVKLWFTTGSFISVFRLRSSVSREGPFHQLVWRLDFHFVV
jgi:hypothetical protein